MTFIPRFVELFSPLKSVIEQYQMLHCIQHKTFYKRLLRPNIWTFTQLIHFSIGNEMLCFKKLLTTTKKGIRLIYWALGQCEIYYFSESFFSIYFLFRWRPPGDRTVADIGSISENVNKTFRKSPENASNKQQKTSC